MRAAAWSQSRDIAAALVNWERAARIADTLPGNDPNRLAMCIAPRTLACANGWRVHTPIAGEHFEQLRDLCAVAGDKVSLAIGMAGLIGESVMNARLSEASRLANELMALIESVGDPTLTVGCAVTAIPVKYETGELEEVLRLSQIVIDLAEGDRAKGNYVVGSPLASAYAMRCAARFVVGRDGWRDDFSRAVAMARDADPISRSMVVVYTYGLTINGGVVLADDAAMRYIDDVVEAAQRSADDMALGLALTAKGIVSLHRDSAAWATGVEVLEQVRDMAVGGRFPLWQKPAIDLCIGGEMMRRSELDRAIPLLRTGVDEIYSSGMFMWCTWGADLLVEALLARGAEADVQEAGAAFERVTALSVFDGWAHRELIMLRMRALLARARGDEVTYRQFADRYREMAESLGFEGHIAMAKAMT